MKEPLKMREVTITLNKKIENRTNESMVFLEKTIQR